MREKAAGVPFPAVTGSYTGMALAKFDDAVTALKALAYFVIWNHSGDLPDLPGGHTTSPSYQTQQLRADAGWRSWK
jgi:hypothetical protein